MGGLSLGHEVTGRQLGAAGRAALRAEECEVPPWAARLPLGRLSTAAAQPVHCSALHVTGEQAVWHEAALWPLVWPIGEVMGWSQAGCLDHISALVKCLVLKTNTAIKIAPFMSLLYHNCASPLDL